MPTTPQASLLDFFQNKEDRRGAIDLADKQSTGRALFTSTRLFAK